ncbi:MAG: putative transposase [Gammaproteobacteria bacterium]|jgi:putative transposase
MPRANRYFLPGHIWHITHRCHKKEFLLKFSRDRARWIAWLFEAKKRYGLCVLNYVVTSNHIHLLVKDTGKNAIPRSLQLIAGRTAQEYNLRKGRKGAFWEDRYHATAVASDAHFLKCLVYIDLNMVRAGVVKHPSEWQHGGYQEIQHPSKRYRIVDLPSLMELADINDTHKLQHHHRQWLTDELARNNTGRDPTWSESLAVGSEDFVGGVQASLGKRADHRSKTIVGDKYILRETPASYTVDNSLENSSLSSNNMLLWNSI